MINFKKLFLIIVPLVLVALFLMMSRSFNRKILMDYQNYTLDRIDVSNKTILIEGGFDGASGIGYDGFDYSIENDTIYLKIYQQNIFLSKKLDGDIDIKLDGNFSNVKDIYLIQPKGELIRIWSLESFTS